ncbi:hypothetical protein [Ureibacillus sinduriensis]|uniref:MYM-type domain-containing protein n=1 Tax=Ureibacillus sinduriensis BLB-1 = JCM 15800 TaxID=1384057 RepID=A0A0A3HTU8_9BACL|nr:hypothetical protein [Ureibacillus sinduriensis]KGR75844.1 hypothetical protein CD33_10100 [Ureibacillus sinduriensis BLB-1 = JCM 15800]
MDLDYQMMTELTAIELNLEELKVGYKKKYFRKDLIKAWSFKCHRCDKKVSSNEADEYFNVYVSWIEGLGTRFCSKDCSDIFYNELLNELLARRDQLIKHRELLGKFYSEAEQKFLR